MVERDSILLLSAVFLNKQNSATKQRKLKWQPK